MYRYGIVSTASISERFIRGIRESKNGKVRAIASRSLEAAQSYASTHDIPVAYGSYDDLYNDKDIDIIYISVMNGLHYSEAKKALSHHKHVIVEKPFVIEPSEAEELFTLAHENNCFLMEAQKSVFLPVTLKLKELLQTIGDISYIELKAGFPKRFDYDHWMYDTSTGGGALYGSASYTLEYLMYLFGDVDEEMNGIYRPSPTGSDEICHFTCKINNKTLVASTIAMDVALDNSVVFYGTEGRITVPNFWKANQLIVTTQGSITYHYPYTSEFVYEVDHIHECLDKGLIESPINTHAKTLKTCRMVDALYKKWLLK